MKKKEYKRELKGATALLIGLDQEYTRLVAEHSKLLKEADALRKNEEKLAKENEYLKWAYDRALEFGAYVITENLLNGQATIKKVHTNKPVTVIEWSDGTKTKAVCDGKDKENKEKGIYLCIAKKFTDKNTLDNILNGYNPDALKEDAGRSSVYKDCRDTYLKLSSPNKKERLDAINKWKDFPCSIRQSVAARARNERLLQHEG